MTQLHRLFFAIQLGAAATTQAVAAGDALRKRAGEKPPQGPPAVAMASASANTLSGAQPSALLPMAM